MTLLLDLVSHSIFLVPIALCGLLALAISVERIWFLRFRASLEPEAFMAQLQRLVLESRLDHALALTLQEPKAPLANVARAALNHASASREDLVLAVEQASLEAGPMVQKRIAYLATIANVVTLFGLLGTIVGLITSFDAVSQADPNERQALLAGGIAMAMYATAGGITVAIPTLAAYAWLVARANHILDDADRCGLKLVMLLLARQRRDAEVPAPAAPATELAAEALG